MEVAQIYTLMNGVTTEILGKENVVLEDLSNVVDVGKEILDASSVDAYVKSLVNHIGKVIFVNRAYAGSAPSVLMDGWEFGSILEKISTELPEAEENESWELQDRTSYDPNIFYKPKATAKFWNKRVTFEIPMSFTEKQVKQSFSNASQLNGFLSMLYNSVDKSLTVKIDSLIMRTINNMTAETLFADIPDGNYSTNSGIKAVNLLKLYNDKFGTTLQPADSLTNGEFIRFASYTMGLYSTRLAKMSTLFNIGGQERFTPKQFLHFILLADFAEGANVYLQSDTFNKEFTSLPNHETIPYWQGSGKTYAFNDISKIHVKTSDNHTVEAGGILGVMFDRDALGVSNVDRRVTTAYNPKGEFYNNFYKYDAGYFNDANENFVVFFVA